MSADSLKNTWESIFQRKGGDGVYTRLVDRMEPWQRSTLAGAVKLRPSELPVIGSLGAPNNWVLLTTQRLIWVRAEEQHEIDIEAIRDATADFRQFQNIQDKLEMRTVQVTTFAGDKYTIELEPGKPLSGVWNVLKNLGTRNRNAKKQKSIFPP